MTNAGPLGSVGKTPTLKVAKVAKIVGFAMLAIAATGCSSTGCSKPTERYESAVQIVRKEAVEKTTEADGGAPTTLQVDFEVEWDACPGDQYQVIRGDKEFAACTEKYDVGDYVPVIVRHYWDARGFYRWDIERMGDCPRVVEPDSFGSYEKSAECKDITNHGKVVGFDCSRKPFRQLLKRCPWMKRD